MIFEVTVRSNFRKGSQFLSSGADYSLLDKSSSTHSAEKSYDVVRLNRTTPTIYDVVYLKITFLNAHN